MTVLRLVGVAWKPATSHAAANCANCIWKIPRPKPTTIPFSITSGRWIDRLSSGGSGKVAAHHNGTSIGPWIPRVCAAPSRDASLSSLGLARNCRAPKRVTSPSGADPAARLAEIAKRQPPDYNFATLKLGALILILIRIQSNIRIRIQSVTRSLSL